MAKETKPAPEIMEVVVDNKLLNQKLNVIIEQLEEVLARLRTKRRPNYVG